MTSTRGCAAWSARRSRRGPPTGCGRSCATVIDGLVDAVAPSGRADVAVDICEPYPIPIICELLGAPKEDWKQFSRVGRPTCCGSSTATSHEDLPIITPAQDELDEYTRGLIADRRRSRRDDLLTDLIAAEEAGRPAVDRGAGDDGRGGHRRPAPTRRATSSAARWRCSPSTPTSGRCSPSSRSWRRGRSRRRCATSAPCAAPAGSPARTSSTAACCSRPGTFIVDVDGHGQRRCGRVRPGGRDVRHHPGAAGQPQLTFGSGIHYCLGAALARAELQEALPILARRMPDLAVAGPITWKPNTVAIFGPDHLPVTFTPTSP